MKTTERILCDDRGRDQTDAITSQGMPRIAGHHQQVRRAEDIFHPEFEREHGPANTVISDF